MLQTPDTFQPLIRPPEHAIPATLLVCRGQLLLRNNDHALPEAEVIEKLKVPAERLHPLGLWQGCYYQMGWVDEPEAAVPGYGFAGLRSLFGVIDDGLAALAARAVQLAEWARTHQYCGVCATPMQRLEGERCYACPACDMRAYPRISPAMMVLVRKGDAVLLAQHARPGAPRYTALAGFLEAGESIEDAVHREVYEEVGLRVHNLRYFGSQSWPFPHSLMIAYTADYLSGEIRIDASEITDARWFGPDDAWPELPTATSIAAELLQANRPQR
ncbi:NAD(+) diphosphatase [Pseudoduganella sp. FT93W]|uniref:NAD(+) diphosphatase n=1 Tax=Duganella fentianensis TaxID=2692177 RepID=A0A845HYF3_9BURK|nr:NAD(+) diphosphatase [Duganella fentianensis]MYN46053.1 NAD(+) diphosphatase [Duganella fentianensis]